MNYEDALTYIKSTGKFGSRPGLEVISKLLEKMGNPQKKIKAVHIAGTNGKGSCASYISHILCENGYNTGLFTSPPITEETERIQLNGQYVCKDEFADITEYVKSFAYTLEDEGVHYPTEFELFTAVAFEYFARKKVDFAVLETGMGGRLDATNVCVPVVSIITAIGLDHTQWLGDTLEKIACEKGGIIKNGVPTVLYPEQDNSARCALTKITEENNSQLYDTKDVSYTIKETSIEGSFFDYSYGNVCFTDMCTHLIGVHQVKNAVNAITAILALRESGYNISDDSIRNGIQKTKWQGRFEIVNKKPLVIFDGGHNEQCMSALVKCVDMYLDDYKKILVFSMFKDKDCTNSIALLKGRFNERIVCEMVHQRRAEAEYIASQFEEDVTIIKDTHSALNEAVKRAEEYEKQGIKSAVVVCGSLNLLEEILRKT